MRIKRLFKKYRELFEANGDETSRASFGGELNYEAGKLFYVVFIALFAWLPYIAYDSELHQFPVFAVSVRITFSLISAFLILLKFTPRFKNHPDVLLMVLVVFLYVLTVLVTASAGEAAPMYIGGLTLVIMLPVFMPFPLKFKFSLSAASVALFFITGALTGLNFSNVSIRYPLNDLTISLMFSFMMSYTLNGIRLRSWKQQQKLEKTISDYEKSLSTIFNLAKKAEASDHAKSAFLATMSHEIRTPMNAILGIAQINMQDSELPEKYAAAFEKINVSGKILLDIINDILDMSKIETGKMELKPEEYDTASLINDAVTLNSVRIGSKPIEFIVKVDENLPSKMHGDELRIKQILNNLLSNAVKYTETGHVKLLISHTAQADNVKLEFIVEDTGQGLKPDDCERLFSEEYVRFNEEANRSTEGTGLGLSITKKLVELMNGEISVKSEYGKGSVFTVILEQKTADSTPIGAQTAANLCSCLYTSRSIEARVKINRSLMPYGSVLVVDDVDANLFVAKGLLAPYKIKVKTALSGFKAIEMVEQGEVFDIIFMDHMMPKMDGIEATRKIRELGYSGVIIALTANALTGNEETFRLSGFDGFIAKPIDIIKFNEVLNKHIRDKYPNEAKKHEQQTSALPEKAGVSEGLARVFRGSAKDAAATLREILRTDPAAESFDIKLFTITVHGIKSALANVGEDKAVETAFALEEAGNKGDIEFIRANTENFLKSLEELAEKMSLIYKNADIKPDTDIQEDTRLLKAQLAAVKAACDDYDDTAALAALDVLKEKQWKKETVDVLERIRGAVYLDSDFEKAAQYAEGLMSI